ncbi:hypothetical protein HBI06_058230 [Parastagonospora nodorum]|nr:hypothetical protein HBI06_058230 [Parastagonospora nodorum]
MLALRRLSSVETPASECSTSWTRCCVCVSCDAGALVVGRGDGGEVGVEAVGALHGRNGGRGGHCGRCCWVCGVGDVPGLSS